jgi:hypothetical protein
MRVELYDRPVPAVAPGPAARGVRDGAVAGIVDQRPGGSVTFRYKDSAGNIVSSFRFSFDDNLDMVNPPPTP